MRYRAFAIIALALTAATQSAPPAKSQAKPPTVQQAFVAATALTDAKKHEQAVAAWNALEKRVADNARNVAIIRLRKSESLVALGRNNEAFDALQAALAALPGTDPSLRADRYGGFMRLARIDEATLDYAGAREAYASAKALATENGAKISALRGLITTGAFVDPTATLADAREAESLMTSAKVSNDARGVIETGISELYMNMADFEVAQDHADRAVDALGGLTHRTNIYDTSARSDYAIASLKLGQEDKARKYLAYTVVSGAGNLGSGSQMTPPDCGGETGLRPDDVAIVEFYIADDGSVSYARPVYANRQGVGLSFARQVRNWSWSTEELEDVPAFFRSRARIELRCATVPDRPGIGDFMDGKLTDWLEKNGVTANVSEKKAYARQLAENRATLESLSEGEDLKRLPILAAVAGNPVTPRADSNKLAKQALAIAIAHDAPPLPRLLIGNLVWENEDTDGRYSGEYRDALAHAIDSAPYRSDPQARSAAALLLADAERLHHRSDAAKWLRRVAADPGLRKNDQLRVGALIRLASIEQAQGNGDAARQAFDRSGLAASQCALLDSQPQLKKSHYGGFPREAQRWGFEGWVRLQYDIDPKGHTSNVRTVAAYPPFVFAEAGENVLGRARYTQSYRPDGGLGCGGAIQGVTFKLP